jgi:sugar O-acyltransferase (sialic acid O-acetyltransferase NeuD family)
VKLWLNESGYVISDEAGSMRLLIVGAGGHAQVIAEAALNRIALGEDMTLVGFVDDAPKLLGREYLGVEVLGPLADIGRIPHDAVIVGIGDNKVRARLFERLRSYGDQFATIVHPRAIVALQVEIGAGTAVFAGAIINTGTVIGSNVIINTGATIDHHSNIGTHAHIAPGVHLGGTVTLGEGAFLGVGVNVIPNRTVGAWTTVGAGAAVINDLPDRVMAVGVPAHVIGLPISI